MPSIKTRKGKEERFHIRATSHQKQLIARAAEREKQTLSDFVLENALSAAEAVVGDDASFTLDKDRWNAFCTALDASPRDVPALRNLLTGESVFDGREKNLQAAGTADGGARLF